MKKGKLKTLLAILTTLALGIAFMTGCSATGNATATQQPGTSVSSGTDTDGDGIPNDVEKTYGTNPYIADTDGDGLNDSQDQAPLSVDNPISETSTTPLPITITDLRVEDNATADHLEMTIKNTGGTALGNFDIYYTITDKLDGTTESYYQKLTGLSVAPGKSQTIHFDNHTSKNGHFYGNPYGLYGTSANGLTFNIQFHNAGYQPMDTSVEKAKGVEVAD